MNPPCSGPPWPLDRYCGNQYDNDAFADMYIFIWVNGALQFRAPSANFAHSGLWLQKETSFYKDGVFLGVMSPPFLVPTNTPVRFGIGAVVYTWALGNTHALARFGNAITLHSGGDAFDVPQGVTVNSAQASIADNQFYGSPPPIDLPEPADGLLVVWIFVGLLIFQRGLILPR